MRKALTTGLAVLLPAILTFIIIAFLINLLTNPFLEPVERHLSHFELFQQDFLFFTGESLLRLVSKILIIVGLFGSLVIIGFLGQLFLISRIFQITDLLQHVPFINKIYNASREVVHALFSSQSRSFSKVVLVPFPTPDTLSVGLVAQNAIVLSSDQTSSILIPVFVPGTPNPSVGFMLMFKQEELLFIDMKVEEAMKFIVSCGVVLTPFVCKPGPSYDEKSPA